jgi:hypothetical protein
VIWADANLKEGLGLDARYVVVSSFSSSVVVSSHSDVSSTLLVPVGRVWRRSVTVLTDSELRGRSLLRGLRRLPTSETWDPLGDKILDPRGVVNGSFSDNPSSNPRAWRLRDNVGFTSWR